MAYVEFAEPPKRVQLTPLPDGKLRVDLRENIDRRTQANENGMTTVWFADEYSLVMGARPGLAADIEKDFTTWLARAKAEDNARTLAAECATYEKEMAKNLAGALLDMDFRLMMLEEMGGSL